MFPGIHHTLASSEIKGGLRIEARDFGMVFFLPYFPTSFWSSIFFVVVICFLFDFNLWLTLMDLKLYSFWPLYNTDS